MAVTHLGLILDGNRRWAKERGLPPVEGHRQGYENIKTVGLHALERGVQQLTVFAFSAENWKRAADEVSFLMSLLMLALTTELDFYIRHSVRLRIVGDKSGFSPELQQAMADAEARTAGFTRGQFNLCVNYGGRADIVHAVRSLVEDGVSPADVSEETVASRLWTAGIPDPDFIIRTSGEQRLSGFLTWQSTYSELLFVQKNWPDFTTGDLDAALEEFSRRQRRFGK